MTLIKWFRVSQIYFADNFSVLTIKKLVLDAYLYPAKSFCEKPTIIFEKKKLSFMFDRVLNVPMDT